MQTLSVDQLVGQTLGSYRVERLLGQGRLNAVYLARNLFEQRTDALTLYLVPERFSLEARQRFLVRFLKEAAAISSLKHPHILPVCEYSEYGGYPYLVTPYMTNGSLADVIKQQGRCSHTDVMNMLEQVGEGLEYAHLRGHIHGMLRPSNIVLANDGSMMVAGFGLMHMLQMSGIDQTNRPYAHLLSVVETFMIAPEYVAPEIVVGQAIDKRSDVYALGAILFELLSGRPPFTGEGTMEIAMQHVNQPAPSLRSLAPDVPVALASVINQALERDPDRRFQRVSELVEAFTQVSKGLTGELSNTTGSQPSQRASSSKETTGVRQTGSWQLLPPIVTGKLGSVPSSSSSTSSQMLKLGNQPRKSSGLTGRIPVQKSAPAPAPTQARMSMPQNAPAPALAPERDTQEPQMQPMAVAPVSARPEPAKPEPARPEPKPEPAKSDVAKQESVPNVMQPFDWWSMPGQFQDVSVVPKTPKESSSPRGTAPNGAREADPARPAEPVRPQGALRLSDTDLADPWGMGVEPMMTSSSRLNSRSRPRRRSGGMSRRQVVALLGAGGVLAAGSVLAFAIVHQMDAQQQTTTTTRSATTMTTGTVANQSSATTTTTTTTNPGTVATAPASKQTTTAGHTGTVIAQSNIPSNSAVDFTNPTTGLADILVHLSSKEAPPNGKFVAYDRACTHQKVLVNYDPNTGKLICPLHGSIFDPANNGKVVRGPATIPLAMVPIKVNADGTVTTV
jgi:serine/threonine protein kinase/Rieske Fe-S protein